MYPPDLDVPTGFYDLNYVRPLNPTSMGAGTRHRQHFLRTHTVCAFCGGTVPAESIEHCPPRGLFQHRQWPEGFEFPAFNTCNQGTNEDDLVVAMLARMDPFEEKGNKDGRLTGLMQAVNRQNPGLFQKMMPTAAEARRKNRELGIEPKIGQTHQEASGVNVPEEFHAAVCTLAKKLVKGIYYRDTGRIFPNSGCLLLNWFTNADFLRDGKCVVFDLLSAIGGNVPPVHRAGTYLNDQFSYKITFSPDTDILVLQAKFGNAFGLVVFGCTLEGRLETMIQRLRDQTEKDGPFAVLQSPSLT
jgi:hypothetical protein